MAFREGCTENFTWKVWSFAKPPSSIPGTKNYYTDLLVALEAISYFFIVYILVIVVFRHKILCVCLCNMHCCCFTQKPVYCLYIYAMLHTHYTFIHLIFRIIHYTDFCCPTQQPLSLLSAQRMSQRGISQWRIRNKRKCNEIQWNAMVCNLLKNREWNTK